MKVGAGLYTYELVENFARLPEGETFGLISRVTTDSQKRLYVFQRKDPAVLVFDQNGKYLSSWGSGQFKRAHGFKIVNDVVYLTDQTDNVALIYTLDGKAVGDKWQRILVILNGNTEGGRFKIPKGKWRIVGDGETINVKSKRDFKGDEIIVPPVSAMILVE